MKGQTSYPRVYLPNQRLVKSDRLSQDAHNPEKLFQGAIQNTLDERDCKASNWGQAEIPLSRTPRTNEPHQVEDI